MDASGCAQGMESRTGSHCIGDRTEQYRFSAASGIDNHFTREFQISFWLVDGCRRLNISTKMPIPEIIRYHFRAVIMDEEREKMECHQ
jgi:hypothetical protein